VVILSVVDLSNEAGEQRVGRTFDTQFVGAGEGLAVLPHLIGTEQFRSKRESASRVKAARTNRGQPFL
jgi:hypothetical protein